MKEDAKYRISEETRSSIILLYREDGFNVSDIQKKTGISRPTIYKVLKGIDKGDQYIINKTKDEFIIDLYMHNYSISRISKKGKVDSSKVTKVLKHHNIPLLKGRRWKYLIGHKQDGWLRITPNEYDSLLAKQNNRCAICGSEFEYSKPMADHRHGELKIRGFLCRRCNIGLSFIEDVEFRNKAIEYLKSHQE